MLPLTGYDFDAHIHQYHWKELNIVMDVNSGAIHVLDDLAYHLLHELRCCQGDLEQSIANSARKYPLQEVREAAHELIEAREAGALFSLPEDIAVDLTRLSVKALCLNVAHACNMKCRYCFASQGDFGMKPSLMSLDMGKKALDFLIAQSGSRINLEVDFFGGEPLLNTAMVQDLVSYARQREMGSGKKFNFTLTTNALLLDEEVMKFVIDEQIGVILSLDGRPEVNDRHRILNDGQGSYDLVVPNIKRMVEQNPVSYYVRGTFTRKNLDFTRDLQHIIELGFNNLSLEPAVGPDNGFSIVEKDLPRVLSEYEHLTDLLAAYQQSGREVNFFHYNLDLQKGPCLAKRSTGCGAGVEYLVVTPTGDIYPCHQFVGQEDFLMGNILHDEPDQKIRSLFASQQLTSKECQNCWCRYFCGGGCHASAFFSNGDLAKPNKVSCAMHKKRVEGAIYLDLISKYPCQN